jgi:hypothetical protein
MERKVFVDPVGQLLLQVLSYYPRWHELSIIRGCSPLDHGSHHRGLTYHGSRTAALDIAARTPIETRELAAWLYSNFAPDLIELVHATPFGDDDGLYVRDQEMQPACGGYGPGDRAAHRDRVHFASSAALAGRMLARLTRHRSDAVRARAPSSGAVG